MSRASPRAGTCPICARELPPGAPERPFCSKRCKLVDLGRWLDGAYVVPGEDTLDLGDLAPPEDEDDDR